MNTEKPITITIPVSKYYRLQSVERLAKECANWARLNNQPKLEEKMLELFKLADPTVVVAPAPVPPSRLPSLPPGTHTHLNCVAKDGCQSSGEVIERDP